MVKRLKLMPWGQSPGERGWTSGHFVPIGGVETGPVDEEDVEEILYHYCSTDDWDGHEVAIMRLKDGRFVGYESWWGPTGDGFSEDAYGGDTNLYFSRDLNALVLEALTDRGRRMVGIPDVGLE